MVLIECPKLRQFGEIKPVCKGLDFGGNFWVTGDGNTYQMHRPLNHPVNDSHTCTFCIFGELWLILKKPYTLIV